MLVQKHTGELSKEAADEQADRLRKEGFLVRVVKSGRFSHSVYSHLPDDSP
jgi:hypothetical protein